jgi:hypothetical protein
MVSLLTPAQKKVSFRVLRPLVIERSSQPDPEKPLAVYKITRNNWATRLVFRTGGNTYWGIEETNWDDAPVLSDRSFAHVLGGRHYDFYFNGPHLHMIVLRENGASYWVVNTLLDDLSNETMIAIAKGLKPLPGK